MNQRELSRQALRIQKGNTSITQGYWKPKRLAEAKSRILDELVAGKTLKSCIRHKGPNRKIINPEMPTMSTFLGWLTVDLEFARKYDIALEHRGDALADEIIDIADDQKLSPESRRVMVNARQWAASKLKPKRYGDKLEHTGEVKNTLDIVVSAGQSLDARLERLTRPEHKMIDITPQQETTNG